MSIAQVKMVALAAVRQNSKPGLALQAFALVMVRLYFFVPALKPVFALFGDLKQDYSWKYSACATALFGGAIPFLFMMFAGLLRTGRPIAKIVGFYLLFWALKGVEVDYFYRFQTYLFGNLADFKTLTTKVLFDQFVYSALWAAPFSALMFRWLDFDFNWKETRHSLDRVFFTVTLPANVISNWLVWIPAVACIYSMPEPLQIPLFNLVLCFWVLMLAALNKKIIVNSADQEVG
jgi:hypothetical protein